MEQTRACAGCSCGANRATDTASATGNAGGTAARWYARYLVGYAVASLVLAAVCALVPGTFLAVAVTMPFWLVVLVGLAAWTTGRRAGHASPRARTAVLGGWLATWAVTLGLGATVFAGRWPWFLACGAVLAAIALVGAYLTRRRRSRS